MLVVGGLPKGSNQVVGEALEQMNMSLRDAQSNLSIAQWRMTHVVDKTGGLRTTKFKMRWFYPWQTSGRIALKFHKRSMHYG